MGYRVIGEHNDWRSPQISERQSGQEPRLIVEGIGNRSRSIGHKTGWVAHRKLLMSKNFVQKPRCLPPNDRSVSNRFSKGPLAWFKPDPPFVGKNSGGAQALMEWRSRIYADLDSGTLNQPHPDRSPRPSLGEHFIIPLSSQSTIAVQTQTITSCSKPT